MDSGLIELKFVNSDARPKTTVLHVAPSSIALIMAWYGAYYAGDRYAVFADGEKLSKDKNGELVEIAHKGNQRGRLRRACSRKGGGMSSHDCTNRGDGNG